MPTGTIIMPTTHDDSEIVVEAAKQELATKFGGYSAYRGQGGWVDDQGELIEEPHVRLEVAGDSTSSLAFHLVRIAQHFRHICDEDAVLVTVQDSEIFMVGGK